MHRPQTRGATSTDGDQLNDTVALTPHSTPHSVTARQHATHHTLSPLNAKKPRAETRAKTRTKTRGERSEHKHPIPTADKRPRGGAERGGGGRATLGPHQAPPTKKKRHPPPTNDPQSRTTTKPTERAPRPRAQRPNPGGGNFYFRRRGHSFIGRGPTLIVRPPVQPGRTRHPPSKHDDLDNTTRQRTRRHKHCAARPTP